MKITKIDKGPTDHTWDIEVSDGAQYTLANGCISHNTSSQLGNATNGIEPPRAFVSIKGSKDSITKQVVPEYHRLKNKYELLWDQPSPLGYIKLVAVMQKYVDQSISGNTSYNPKFYPDGRIPMSTLMGDMLTMYKYGWKTAYYANAPDGASDESVDDLNKDNDCGDACKI